MDGHYENGQVRNLALADFLLQVESAQGSCILHLAHLSSHVFIDLRILKFALAEENAGPLADKRMAFTRLGSLHPSRTTREI